MAENDAKFVGDIPKHYDQGLGPVIFEPFAQDIARRAARLKPSAVLELAAGTGIVSARLLEVLPHDGQLTITDLNPPMLEIARAKTGADRRVRFSAADASALQFEAGSFDLVVCQFGVMFFPDKIAAFREALRVLRPGGDYIFNAWGAMAENPFSQVAYDAQADFYKQDPPQFYRAPYSYPDPEIVTADARAAGFAGLRHEAVSFDTPVASWTAFARGIVFGNPSINELIEREIDPEEVVRSVTLRLESQWGAAPAAMPVKAHVYEGRAPS